MTDLKTDDFQKKVSHLIIRNQNVVDILTKCQSACSKICRSSVKTATGCGCLRIDVQKGLSPISSEELTGISGELCPECKDIIEKEIGELFFYIAGLCNALGLSMRDIMKKEIKNIEVLGKYSLR